MGAGVSVEFTAHLVASYTLEGQDMEPWARMTHALSQVGPPMVMGSISTFLGTLPMAISPAPFVVLYLFLPFVLVCVIGTFTGLSASNLIEDRCFDISGKKQNSSSRRTEGGAIRRQWRC